MAKLFEAVNGIRPKSIGLAGILLLACSIATAGPASKSKQSTNWTLVWSDEFNGPAGSAPDTAKWTYDIGGGGWGNNELEYYTNSRNNSYMDGQGNLVIKALADTSHAGYNYTSARLKTQGLYNQSYGKFEARIKIPYGQGIWPAFWMLGNDITTVGWPTCGEIDIMENIGKEPSTIHGSLHGPGYDFSGQIALPNGASFSSDFHVFTVEWDTAQIRFYMDGTLYETVNKSQVSAGKKWVFDHPFFFLLNLAVGGNWPGSPDTTTTFPQTMVVDYVRAYTAGATGAPAAPTALSASGSRGKINLNWMQSTSGGITQNRIYRSSSSGGPFSAIATISAASKYTDSTVTRGVKYYYVVTALSAGGESVHSNQASATPR